MYMCICSYICKYIMYMHSWFSVYKYRHISIFVLVCIYKHTQTHTQIRAVLYCVILLTSLLLLPHHMYAYIHIFWEMLISWKEFVRAEEWVVSFGYCSFFFAWLLEVKVRGKQPPLHETGEVPHVRLEEL